ncbi:purine-nucleoside phosphorylase [Olivibacter ginsenosidimutans]|uniref:Purine nucleoside phosphorylase n=1 Tax=Olivibacter ginsenosidimutans TaxID=1176537 RepID=A0ABP9BS55_9SPHI
MYRSLGETVNYIQQRTAMFGPEVGIILGTGLGGLVSEMQVEYQLMYTHIPNFPVSTLEFHSGKLIFGTLNNKRVVAMQGRLHYYEGYSMQEITFPVRVLKLLGIKQLFVSNASGSLNPTIKKGDLVIIRDHISLLPESPLRGPNNDDLGPRFPDMSQPYHKELISKALKIAEEHNIRAHSGVYVSAPGPNLETKAEYKYMRLIGGDVVGMSTVPEVIVANHMGLPVFAVSVVTDEGFHEALEPVSIDDILAVAKIAEPKMTAILKELIVLS